jgi:hypothetical protein
VCQIKGTKDFEKRYREILPQGNARFMYEPGDHGFDRTASVDEVWMKEGLDAVNRYWGIGKTVNDL